MKTTIESSYDVLNKVLEELKTLEDYSCESLHECLIDLAKKLEVKNGYLLWPIRVAVSGKQFTPGGAIELCAILGKEEVVKRIELALSLLKEKVGN